MPDERTYIRLHDGMPDHPKIDGLSDKAFRLLVETWCWCSRHLTDGRVPAVTWRKRGTPRARRELEAAGLAIPAPDGAILMHDYLQHQRSADEVAELREKRREAGKQGGKASASARAHAQANASADAQANSKQSSTIVRDRDRSASNEALSGAALDERFTEFWAAYPRRVAKGQALKAWRAALRRGAEPGHIIEAAGRYAHAERDTEATFVKHPATWLNGQCYDDEQPEQQPAPHPHDAWAYGDA